MPERPPHNPDNRDCECFRCHVRSINISPAALPTRRNKIAPKGVVNNNYERAEPRDHRGMPYLDSNLNPISQKALDASRRQRDTAIRHPESVKDVK